MGVVHAFEPVLASVINEGIAYNIIVISLQKENNLIGIHPLDVVTFACK